MKGVFMNNYSNFNYQGNNLNNQDEEDTIYPVGRNENLFQLVCQEHAGGCGATMTGYSVNECIEKWNKRT
jgi:hypothetical protein